MERSCKSYWARWASCFLCQGDFVVKVNCNHLQKVHKTLSDNKYVLHFHIYEKPSCQTNNNTSRVEQKMMIKLHLK